MEQNDRPNRRNQAKCHQRDTERRKRQAGEFGPAEQPADRRGQQNIHESPNGRRQLEHRRTLQLNFSDMSAAIPLPSLRAKRLVRRSSKSEGGIQSMVPRGTKL